MKQLLSDTKEKVDIKIQQVLTEEINNNDNDLIKDAYKELLRLSEGGKRIRSLMIRLGKMIINKEDFEELSVAIEIFQTAVLIHDDIIDKANYRRNKETINYKYKGHFGNSKAICVGDAGFFLANRIISTYNPKLTNIFNVMCLKTVEGQIIDVELPYQTFNFKLNATEKMIYDIYVNKTSYYTFVGPMLLGTEGNHKDDITKLGINLGILFQLKDDLLGTFGKDKNIGKSANDIKEKKCTLIYKHAIDNASKEEKIILKKHTDEEEIRKIFKRTNSLEYVNSIMNRYYDETIKIINEMEYLSDNVRKILLQIAKYIIERTY